MPDGRLDAEMLANIRKKIREASDTDQRIDARRDGEEVEDDPDTVRLGSVILQPTVEDFDQVTEDDLAVDEYEPSTPEEAVDFHLDDPLVQEPFTAWPRTRLIEICVTYGWVDTTKGMVQVANLFTPEGHFLGSIMDDGSPWRQVALDFIDNTFSDTMMTRENF